MKRTMSEDRLHATENVRSLLSAMSYWTLPMKWTIGEDGLQAPENVRSFLSAMTCWILQTMERTSGEDSLQTAVMFAHEFQL